MSRFRALLVGVPDYDDDAFDKMPFIRNDLETLSGTLREVGYDVKIHDESLTDRDRIDDAVEQFCRAAGQGDTLLILLSGHGMHREGVDYLIPSSANTRSRKFTERCLPINFKDHIESSRCGNVLVIVDACREGVHLQEKGPLYATQWSRMKREAVAGRTVAYLYACSEGERARFVANSIDSYSVLTRAFHMVAMGDTGPATLTAVTVAVREQVEELISRDNLQAQKVKLELPPRVELSGTADKLGEFIVFERPDGTEQASSEHPWRQAVEKHKVWNLTAADTELREATTALVQRWAAVSAKHEAALADDPWWDPQLPVRTAERLGWMLNNVINEDKLALEGTSGPLSSGEAALLILFPFAHQTFWAQHLHAHANVVAKGDDAFDRFIQGHPRLARRLARTPQPSSARAVEVIRWWLLHRWLISRGDLYEPARVAKSLALLDGDNALLVENLTPQRLSKLIRSQRLSVPEVVRSDVPDPLEEEATLATATPQEQHLREQLTAVLLGVARLLAVDPADLGPVIAEHVGITENADVDLKDMLRTVQNCNWPRRRGTRMCVLKAECTHPAVDQALVEHAARVTTTLQQVDALAAKFGHFRSLSDLPTHASADDVRAVHLPSGELAYDGQGFRFRLADDRIQELLMGKQLYGDPHLAVRELYQNALDACRYRRARVEHLRRIDVPVAPWQGEITFRQGNVDGRPYLDCIDNGIGMGRRELTEVFSNAGVRFADLPEFIEEKAEWDREGIPFHANSAFGIGVLSYFMIADEITVTTSRLDRKGRPGSTLEVHIPDRAR
ncbi:caspase family protein [Actinosynnema sp. NPDC051121]